MLTILGPLTHFYFFSLGMEPRPLGVSSATELASQALVFYHSVLGVREAASQRGRWAGQEGSGCFYGDR